MWYLKSNNKDENYLWYKLNNIFNNEEISSLVNLMSNKTEIATTRNDNDSIDTKAFNKSVRDSRVAFLTPYDKYDLYYRKLTDAINYVNNNIFKYQLNYLEPMQYTVYDSSYKGHYDWHLDYQIGGNQPIDIRKLSFSVLLDDPDLYEGGDLTFKIGPKDDVVKDASKGDVIFFPSCVLHKVTPVTSGIRRSLVGWVHGPQWC